jgi:hypothetical protein
MYIQLNIKYYINKAIIGIRKSKNFPRWVTYPGLTTARNPKTGALWCHKNNIQLIINYLKKWEWNGKVRKDTPFPEVNKRE